MSVQSDYITIADKLWNTEEIFMIDPPNHSSLAYVLEKLSTSDNYSQTVKEWNDLIDNKQYNECAWRIINKCAEYALKDDSITQKNKDWIARTIGPEYQLFYKKGELFLLGVICGDDAPEWFYPLYSTYMKMRMQLDKDSVIKYLVYDCNLDENKATNIYDTIAEDITLLREFVFYVNHKYYLEKGRNKMPLKFLDGTGEKEYGAKELSEEFNVEPYDGFLYLYRFAFDNENDVATKEFLERIKENQRGC